MVKLGVRCVSRAVSGTVLTDFGKAACVSLLLVLSCVLLSAFAQASDRCTPAMKVKEGSGTSSSPYRIATLCQLQDISSNPTAYYELVDNIDASETRVWNDGAGFRPIASTATVGFSGSFVNASTHVVSSLTISRSSTNNVGLFSKLAEGAMIRGVILVGSRTTGRNSVGSLVGFNAGVIEGCSATGSVFGGNRIGGLVGFSEGSIRNSHADSTVTGDGFYVGGLVGDSRSDISGSHATGFVSGDDFVGGLVGSSDGNINNSSATGSVFGVEQVGGLVGRNEKGVSISRSYAESTVTGRDDVGGLVGVSFGSIDNSYAASTVRGTDYVGGLVGRNEEDASIGNTYAFSTVTGTTTRTGGLVGFSEGSIVSSYYTGQENGWGERRTLVQLRCPTAPDAMCPLPTELVTYAGWDSRVWNFGGTDDLPQLRIEEGDGGDPTAIPLRVRVYLGGAVR